MNLGLKVLGAPTFIAHIDSGDYPRLASTVWTNPGVLAVHFKSSDRSHDVICGAIWIRTRDSNIHPNLTSGHSSREARRMPSSNPPDRTFPDFYPASQSKNQASRASDPRSHLWLHAACEVNNSVSMKIESGVMGGWDTHRVWLLFSVPSHRRN